MVREIDSEMMKRAVGQLFNHELEKNGKVSSHSQLERWIIKELEPYFNSVSAVALQRVLKEIRDIDFKIEVSGQLKCDKDRVTLNGRYADHNMFISDTGSNLVAFRYSADDDHYALVTTEDGDDVPENLQESIQFGLYSADNDLLFHKKFESSIEMFLDKHITYLLGC